MRRPSQVKIGWTTWKIKWLNEKQWKEAEGASPGDGGLTWSATHEIWIRTMFEDTKEDALRVILLHEILHACATVSDCGNAVTYVKPKDAEEVLIGGLSGPLLAVLRDNPSIRDYLLDR